MIGTECRCRQNAPWRLCKRQGDNEARWGGVTLIDNGRAEDLYDEFQTALDDALLRQSKMALAKRRRSAGNTDHVDAEMRAGFGRYRFFM